MWKPFVVACVFVAGSVATALSHDVQDPATLQKPNIRDLLSTALESAEGLEVIVSHVALPADVTLPMHWHPGEEFAYILQGSVTLILEEEGEHEAFAGDVGVVPLKKFIQPDQEKKEQPSWCSGFMRRGNPAGFWLATDPSNQAFAQTDSWMGTRFQAAWHFLRSHCQPNF
ncbi:cupin domain-containing protein [Sulfitobacter sediminilitoris]|uniref:cupin domain-containing protein n=1 Tax=Sulfitobacter sediminilitoris TaxID=2698830 RepID=UPI00360A9B87